MWQRLKNLLRRREADAAFFAELEATLLAADVGPALTERWLQQVRKWKRGEDVERELREAMLMLLQKVAQPPQPVKVRPRVVMVLGVNGAGKTTTIAKLASRAMAQGQQPLLVAADTFRAAAIEQLQVWGNRLGVPVIAQKMGSDAAAVAFDGVKAATARSCDVVFVDTAGRLHTKTPLMDELAKVRRVMGKALEGAPHERWCVLDAMIGQNAIPQARHFHETVQLTGLIVTKLDGTARAGVLFTLADTLALPVHYLGRGETAHDLELFDPASFIDAILSH
ncbi:MAG: signal recognition particle-docking protein FtsY [Deltaproteobacteria bacterium]|nr:signal recognition particle-docking protein FtsY [Deltaproteobacteria bacterium]